MEWTIKSITDQSRFILEPALSPIGGVPLDGVDVLNRDGVSGPQIKPEGSAQAKALRVSWLTTAVAGRKAYECLCSSLGLWAGSLRRSGGQASVTSNYPPLPSGTRTVEVILPGVATIAGITVVDAEDWPRGLAPQSRTPAKPGATTATAPRAAGRPLNGQRRCQIRNSLSLSILH